MRRRQEIVSKQRKPAAAYAAAGFLLRMKSGVPRRKGAEAVVCYFLPKGALSSTLVTVRTSTCFAPARSSVAASSSAVAPVV